jgi:hypothetical protein
VKGVKASGRVSGGNSQAAGDGADRRFTDCGEGGNSTALAADSILTLNAGPLYRVLRIRDCHTDPSGARTGTVTVAPLVATLVFMPDRHPGQRQGDHQAEPAALWAQIVPNAYHLYLRRVWR